MKVGFRRVLEKSTFPFSQAFSGYAFFLLLISARKEYYFGLTSYIADYLKQD